MSYVIRLECVRDFPQERKPWFAHDIVKSGDVFYFSNRGGNFLKLSPDLKLAVFYQSISRAKSSITGFFSHGWRGGILQNFKCSICEVEHTISNPVEIDLAKYENN